MSIFAKFFGTKNDRELKQLMPRVAAINALESTFAPWSDAQLKERILQLKEGCSKEIADKEQAGITLKRADINKILDPYLHEVFAITREAGKRVLGQRHFDVQLLGGMVLHAGKIAEMKTGEGKTLTATLAATLNSLTGKGVHIVTTNDYLASRDAEWMGRIYRFLGLSVGVVIPNVSDKVKKEAYNADITYGQNNEFGFDYLRDNMKFQLDDYVQRGHNFAIVDEVDSILIDEARTPLIISGPTNDSSEKYKQTNEVVPKLRKDVDFSVEEKSRSVMLTEVGISKCEQLLSVENLYDPINLETLHHLSQSLRAHALFKRDVDYVVQNGQIIIVDEHTGRLMHGRRWSDGLHQSVEAKENVKIEAENQTLATITFQNLFRMYKKLSGMTGTADTEAEEFAKIYDLDVNVIPTNKPLIRRDENDLIYKTEREKFDAVAIDIEKSHKLGQPVLVGTVSVEKSEILAKRLSALNVEHNVLNARRHKDEANIVAQAGRIGSVTIATNMAGRGTDIKLGGDPEHMARNIVAKVMHESNAQVAEFAFLTGKPDLIDAEALATRDKFDVRFLSELEASLVAAKAEGKEVNGPKNIDEARELVYQQRKVFYDEAINLYREHLAKCEEICRAEKSKVFEAGGLRIIGTERHESRRIDNQLRGRGGRQGDPGSSCFYMSLQDDLMRIFGSDRMIGMMERLGMEEGVPIEHPLVSKSIANAQKRVEGFHFDSRKQLIEYDDVMNQQRQAVYGLRRKVLGGAEIETLLFDLVEQIIVQMVMLAAPEKAAPSEWKISELQSEVAKIFLINLDLSGASNNRDDLMDYIFQQVEQMYRKKEKDTGPDLLKQVSRFIYLQTIDERWKEHLLAMDHLREGIHFRGYAQKDPKQEYKKEGYTFYQAMMGRMKQEVLAKVFSAEIGKQSKENIQADIEQLRKLQQEELERLRKAQLSTQNLQHNLIENGAPKGKLAAARQNAAKFPNGPGEDNSQNPGMNRHQRRAMELQQRKKGGRV